MQIRSYFGSRLSYIALLLNLKIALSKTIQYECVEDWVPGSRQKALAAAEAAAAADSFGKYPGDSEIFDDPSSLKDYL